MGKVLLFHKYELCLELLEDILKRYRLHAIDGGNGFQIFKVDKYLIFLPHNILN